MFTYHFSTAKKGDVFYVKFVKADGSVRKMLAQFESHCANPDLVMVLDIDLDAPRYINVNRILSVAKVVYKAQPMYMQQSTAVATSVVDNTEDDKYSVEVIGNKWVVFYEGKQIGVAYKAAQIERFISFHKVWKNKKI